jgi:hypothetical protein
MSYLADEPANIPLQPTSGAPTLVEIEPMPERRSRLSDMALYRPGRLCRNMLRFFALGLVMNLPPARDLRNDWSQALFVSRNARVVKHC